MINYFFFFVFTPDTLKSINLENKYYQGVTKIPAGYIHIFNSKRNYYLVKKKKKILIVFYFFPFFFNPAKDWILQPYKLWGLTDKRTYLNNTIIFVLIIIYLYIYLSYIPISFISVIVS